MSGCGLHFMSKNNIKNTGGVPSLPCGDLPEATRQGLSQRLRVMGTFLRRVAQEGCSEQGFNT